jgi:hypothetical protein
MQSGKRHELTHNTGKSYRNEIAPVAAYGFFLVPSPGAVFTASESAIDGRRYRSDLPHAFLPLVSSGPAIGPPPCLGKAGFPSKSDSSQPTLNLRAPAKNLIDR